MNLTHGSAVLDYIPEPPVVYGSNASASPEFTFLYSNWDPEHISWVVLDTSAFPVPQVAFYPGAALYSVHAVMAARAGHVLLGPHGKVVRANMLGDYFGQIWAQLDAVGRPVVAAGSARPASDTLVQILSEIRRICNPTERDEDTPAEDVCAHAAELIKRAHAIEPIAVDATAVEGSEGDLLIHWDTSTRSVVLICPKDGRPSSIYKETLQGVKPVSSELKANASPELLSEALGWLIREIR